MFRRYALGFQPVKQMSTMSSSATPIEDAIRSKVSPALSQVVRVLFPSGCPLQALSNVHEPEISR